jgi:hypothetical protein
VDPLWLDSEALIRWLARTEFSSLDVFPMVCRSKQLQKWLLLLVLFPLACLSGVKAQSSGSSGFHFKIDQAGADAVNPASPVAHDFGRPFSKMAVGPSFSPLGIGVDLTTNLNRHLNLRASGGFLDQPIHFSTNGFHADARLKLASTRASLDIYPFHNGLRISPGVMVYNQNRITGTQSIAGGASFTLNGDTFFSDNANSTTGAVPVYGTALLNLHATRPAFTITGGWGNPLARNGHWSFPLEVGVALVGAPEVKVTLAGWACLDPAETQCANITNPNNSIAVQVQNDLQAEIGKWKGDLDPLKTFPIIKGGVTYSFNLGRH